MSLPMDWPRQEQEAEAAAAAGIGELDGLVAGQPRFAEYARLLESWSGLLSGPALPLIEDSLTLLSHLEDARTAAEAGAAGAAGHPARVGPPEGGLLGPRRRPAGSGAGGRGRTGRDRRARPPP